MTAPAANLPETVLNIVAIELTGIRVPLRKTYRGSYYKMTHRSTLLCRSRIVDSAA